MRLTDEERAIADRVAERMCFDGMRPAHAWECAVNYIAARRKAFGEVETPGTATAAGVAAPRGVVVTQEHREAVKWARDRFLVSGHPVSAAALDGLLDAIDAAKGGGA